MRLFIDVRFLKTNKISGIPEYSRHLISGLVKKEKDWEIIFFFNSFFSFSGFYVNYLKNLVSQEKERLKILDFHIPNRFLDLGFRFFNFPKVDSFIKADCYYSPNINILALKDYQKRILTICLLFIIQTFLTGVRSYGIGVSIF